MPSADAPRPLHAPYAGRHAPFSIAMAPLDPADWLEFDGNRHAELAQKRAIFATGDAFRAAPDTEAAQTEALGLIEAHLVGRGILPAIERTSGPPLLDAALAVQDDLILMRQGEDGLWHLAAAALAFPSAWSLAEKFARPMDTIHADVPGWAGPMGMRVKRIFDALRPDQLVWRLNWSIQFGGGLRRPRSKHEASPPPDPAAPILLRVERQTLRKLPETGDLLFTVKVLLDPVDAFAAHPEGPQLAAALRRRLMELDAAQLSYKALTVERDRVVAALDRFAAVDEGLEPGAVAG